MSRIAACDNQLAIADRLTCISAPLLFFFLRASDLLRSELQSDLILVWLASMSEGVLHLDSSRELALIGDARAKGEMWESRIENPCVLQGVRDSQIYLDVHRMDSIIVVDFPRHHVSDGFLTNVGILERVADGETKLCKQEGTNPAAHPHI